MYLVNVRHFSLVALAPISILIVLGTCAMQLLFSTLADRLFRRSGNLRAYVYVMGAALIVTAVIFFGFVALPSALSLIVVTLNPNGAVFSTAGALIANTTPSRGRATVQSATVALATTAGILAPTITGPIIQAGGSQGYLNAFALSSGLVLLIALISLLFIHPRAQTPDTV